MNAEYSQAFSTGIIRRARLPLLYYKFDNTSIKLLCIGQVSEQHHLSESSLKHADC